MPVQRTRAEEEKLEFKVLRASSIISADAADKLKRMMDKMAQLQEEKPKSKK